MNKITLDMRFKQAVIEYSFKHGVTKAAIWLTRPVTILIFIPLKCVYTKFEEEPSTFMLLTSFTHSRIFKNSWPFISATITISLSKCLCDDEESFAMLLADKTNADILKEKKHIEGELQKCIVRSEQVAELCIKCYEDNVSGKLSDEMFMRFSGKYEAERMELKEKISAYRKRLSEVDEMQLGKEKFIAAVRKFMQMDKLTAPLLRELIDRIDVYEVTGTGKNRKQMIKIHYRFVGYLELPSLGSRHNYREETRKGVAVEYVPNAQLAQQKKSRTTPAHTNK